MLTTDPAKRRHRSPTVKQIRALQLINQGYSKARAMREAGYSKNSAKTHAGELLKARAIMDIYDMMKDSLRDSKLTGDYMAKKFEKWMEAQKDDPDDYKTQLAAAQLYKEIIKPAATEPKGIKRKVTYEEFLSEGPKDEIKV